MTEHTQPSSGSTKTETTSDDAQGQTRQAKEELFEAIEHFKNAATILFDKATKDPGIRTATNEASRVIQKIGATAEPLAKQLTGELSKLTKRITETVQETIEGRRKSEQPPPDTKS